MSKRAKRPIPLKAVRVVHPNLDHSEYTKLRRELGIFVYQHPKENEVYFFCNRVMTDAELTELTSDVIIAEHFIQGNA